MRNGITEFMVSIITSTKVKNTTALGYPGIISFLRLFLGHLILFNL